MTFPIITRVTCDKCKNEVDITDYCKSNVDFCIKLYGRHTPVQVEVDVLSIGEPKEVKSVTICETCGIPIIDSITTLTKADARALIMKVGVEQALSKYIPRNFTDVGLQMRWAAAQDAIGKLLYSVDLL